MQILMFWHLSGDVWTVWGKMENVENKKMATCWKQLGIVWKQWERIEKVGKNTLLGIVLDFVGKWLGKIYQ